MIHHQMSNSRGAYNYNTATYQNSVWHPHFHKNYELVRVTEGCLAAVVDEEELRVRRGEYALILPNQIHSFVPRGHTVYWIVVFSEDFVPLFASSLQNKQGKTPIFRCEEAVDTLLRRELMQGEPSLMMKKSCLYAACDQYLRSVELIERRIKPDFIVGRVLDYIAKNFTDDISLQKCAELLGYEYHYLSRLLGQTYKINFRRTLNGYRVDTAAELLRTSDLSVAEIAFKSGFQSIRSFNQVMKEMLHVTPRELRGSD